MKSLDDALASFNVERQAYYGGTFVGNHVHRSLKVLQYRKTQICNIISITLYCYRNLTSRPYAQLLLVLRDRDAQLLSMKQRPFTTSL